MHIIYKPGPDLDTVNWLSHNNHTENKDEEIADIHISMSASNTSVNMPVCRAIEDIQAATYEDTHLLELKVHILQGWPHRKEEVDHSQRQYWAIGNELAMIVGIIMTFKRMIIPFYYRNRYHLGIEQLRLLACELGYWLNMNADIENTMRLCATYLD